jgi:hypothetical protein
MTDTDTTTTTETTEGATVTPITPATPVRATWKQHGKPTSGWQFFGTMIQKPTDEGLNVAKVETDPQGLTLKAANGRQLKNGRFGTATKFWAVVPADAPRQVAEPKAKGETTPAAPIEITAPKGGDQTVAPRKGAIAKAITATGKSIMAISRDHGLNPSQMRRLSLDQVAKVDLVRAEAIATALGVKLADLFGEPADKAKVAAKNGNGTTPPAETGPRSTGRKSAAQRKADKIAADLARNAERQAAEAAEADQAKAAQDAEAEAGQPETPAE